MAAGQGRNITALRLSMQADLAQHDSLDGVCMASVTRELLVVLQLHRLRQRQRAELAALGVMQPRLSARRRASLLQLLCVALVLTLACWR